MFFAVLIAASAAISVADAKPCGSKFNTISRSAASATLSTYPGLGISSLYSTATATSSSISVTASDTSSSAPESTVSSTASLSSSTASDTSLIGSSSTSSDDVSTTTSTLTSSADISSTTESTTSSTDSTTTESTTTADITTSSETVTSTTTSSEVATSTTSSASATCTPGDSGTIAAGGFENVPDDALLIPGATADGWTTKSGTYSYFSYNVNNDLTPYGEKYVRLDGLPGAIGGVSHEITNVASSTATISYSYKLSGSTEGRGTCSLVITVGQDTVDTFSASSNSGWTTRTASFVPSASSGTLNFSWDCSNFRKVLGDELELDFLLDDISGDFDFACP
ncbi:hypothetical protein G7054_g7606 [Neopestalotiopsis clavispora]|nr:hypothetical protein G7054_g7606 [Neopestalotiopsis clavispora]